MLEKLRTVNELSGQEMLTILHYFNELTTPDRVIVLRSFDKILSKIQNQLNLSPIIIHPEQHPILRRKIEDCPGITKFKYDKFSDMIWKGFNKILQYNYIATKKIFWVNNLKQIWMYEDMLDTQKIEYDSLSTDDIYHIMMMIYQMIKADVNPHSCLVIHHDLKVNLIMKYLLKYKVMAKIELTRINIRHNLCNIIQEPKINFIDPHLDMLLKLIDTKDNSLINGIISMLDQTDANSYEIMQLLSSYCNTKDVITMKVIPLIGLSWESEESTPQQNTLSSFGNIKEEDYLQYRRTILESTVKDLPISGDATFSIPEKVKASIMNEMTDLNYAIIQYGDIEKCLIQEKTSTDVYLMFMENGNIKAIEISRLFNHKPNQLFMEFVDLDLDADYDVKIK